MSKVIVDELEKMMVIYWASHKCAFFMRNEDIVCLLVLSSTTLTVAFRRTSGTFHVSSCIGNVAQYTYHLTIDAT